MADIIKSAWIQSDSSGSTRKAIVVNPENSDKTYTILAVYICNTLTSTNVTFSLTLNHDGRAHIYDLQSLPANSTFIHNSKIIMYDKSGSSGRLEIMVPEGTPGVHVLACYLIQDV